MGVELKIINNKGRERFEVLVGGDYAYVDYRMYNGEMVLMHTFVPEQLRGQHIAEELAKYALEYAEREKLPTRIYCPFITAFVSRHPEYEKWRSKLTKNT